MIFRRRHVKEGNTITYIGAGVNVLLSSMKVKNWHSICLSADYGSVFTPPALVAGRDA